MTHEGLSFYGPRKSDKGADTDIMDNFCGPYLLVHNNLLLQCPCVRWTEFNTIPYVCVRFWAV